jgi:hypothetical protein
MAVAEKDFEQFLNELFDKLVENGPLKGYEPLKEQIINGLMEQFKNGTNDLQLTHENLRDPKFAVQLCATIVNQSVTQKFEADHNKKLGDLTLEEKAELKLEMKSAMKALLTNDFKDLNEKQIDDLADALVNDALEDSAKYTAPTPKPQPSDHASEEDQKEIQAQSRVVDQEGNTIQTLEVGAKVVESLVSMIANNDNQGSGLIAGAKDTLDNTLGLGRDSMTPKLERRS